MNMKNIQNLKTFWATGKNFCGIIAAEKFTFESPHTSNEFFFIYNKKVIRVGRTPGGSSKLVNIFVKYTFIAVIGTLCSGAL